MGDTRPLCKEGSRFDTEVQIVLKKEWRFRYVSYMQGLFLDSIEYRILGQLLQSKTWFTFSLLIMASSESIDKERPCINLLASILA